MFVREKIFFEHKYTILHYGGPIGEVFHEFRCMCVNYFFLRRNIFCARKTVVQCAERFFSLKTHLYQCENIYFAVQKYLGLRKFV